MASWVEAGPGIRLHTAMASSNSRASSQPRRSTHSWRSSRMCAGGPPNPMQPIRPHSRSTVRSGTRGLRSAEAAAAGAVSLGSLITASRPVACAHRDDKSNDIDASGPGAVAGGAVAGADRTLTR